MLSDYTFLTDHSYSLRPVVDDNDELPLNRREVKNKQHRRSSNRTNKTTSTTKRAASIDRSSSDKENNSIILSNSNNVSISSTSTTSVNINKSSTNSRSNKKKSNSPRASRLSTRIAINNSRTQSGKKQDNKTSPKSTVKSTQNSIIKKKKVINRGKTNLFNISQMDFNDAPPSLSIEERVKLRRTKPLQSSPIMIEKKPRKINKSQQDIKQIHHKEKKNSSVISTKLFLGSGLDLDNIVLGNRQRRCVQT